MSILKGMFKRLSLVGLLFFSRLLCISQDYLAPVQMEITSPYYLDSWDMEKGLPQNSVIDIIQPQDGYMWIATLGGICKFDGREFKPFDIFDHPNLKSIRATSLYEDKEGKIWVAYEENGISIISNDSVSSFDPKEIDGIINGTGFIEDNQENLWIGSTKGLIQWKNGVTRIHRIPGALSNYISHLTKDKSNNIWGISGQDQFGETALFKLRDNSFTILDKFPQGSFKDLFIDSQGWIWIVKPGEVLVMNTNDYSVVKRIRVNDDLKLKRIFVDSKENLWLGTGKELIKVSREVLANKSDYQINEQDYYRFGTPLDITIQAIFEDKSGYMWIGTDGRGFFRIAESPVRRYILPDTFNEKLFRSTAVDSSGGIWVASESNGLFYSKDGQFWHDSRFSKIRALAIFQSNEPAISSNSLVLRRKADHTIDTVLRLPGNTDLHTAISLYVDSKDQLWIGTFGAGVYKESNGEIEQFKFPENSQYAINTFHEASDGRMLIGSEIGLGEIIGNTIQFIQNNSEIAPGSVRSILEEKNGTIWIGSYGGGLTRWKNGKYDLITTTDGLFENVVSRILEDMHGNLWLLGNEALHICSKSSINDYLLGKRDRILAAGIGKTEGMEEGNGMGNASVTTDGISWWPTIDGIAFIDHNKFKIDSTENKVIIQQISSMEKSVPIINNRVLINPEQRNIQLSYNTLNFAEPAKIKFQYRLMGFEKKWNDADNRRIINYTNLPPGNFEFQVRASNRTGQWSENPTILNITVSPAFYERAWFYFCLIFLSGFLVYAFVKWRLTYNERKRKLLEEIVKRRTAELEENKIELEGTLANLKSTQNQLIQSEKLASIGTLTAGLAHELNNPLSYIGGIAFPLRMDIEELKNRYHERFGEDEELNFLFGEMHILLANLEHGVSKASSIIKHLMELSPGESSKDSIKFDLSELINNTVHVFERQFTEIAFLYDVNESIHFYGIPSELNQVFTNLLQNAVEATQDIDHDTGKLYVRLNQQGSNIHFIVKNNGPEIPKNNHSKIFEPFFTTKSNQNATGLGLYITYSIIKKYYGELKLVSSTSETVFEIILPFIEKEKTA